MARKTTRSRMLKKSWMRRMTTSTMSTKTWKTSMTSSYPAFLFDSPSLQAYGSFLPTLVYRPPPCSCLGPSCSNHDGPTNVSCTQSESNRVFCWRPHHIFHHGLDCDFGYGLSCPTGYGFSCPTDRQRRTMEVATFRGFVAFREHYLYSCHSHAFYHAVGADHARDHARGVAHPFLLRLAHFVWDLRKLACASALGLDFGATRFLHHPLAEADTHDYAHVAPSS